MYAEEKENKNKKEGETMEGEWKIVLPNIPQPVIYMSIEHLMWHGNGVGRLFMFALLRG